MENMQPGQVIIPHGPSGPGTPGGGSPEPDRPTEQPEPVPTPAPTPEPVTPDAVAETTQEPQEMAIASAALPQAESAEWQFHQEADHTRPAPSLPEDMNWTASEFIAHDKTVAWYASLAAGGLVAAAIIYLITKDKITTGIILLALVAFGVFASRKPRTQQYGLSRDGLQVGVKSYGFQDFKTFSISEEGAIASIVFMPLKRFMPPLTIYVTPELENQVVDFLSAILPFEQHKADAVDSLLRRIHF